MIFIRGHCATQDVGSETNLDGNLLRFKHLPYGRVRFCVNKIFGGIFYGFVNIYFLPDIKVPCPIRSSCVMNSNLPRISFSSMDSAQ